MKVSVLLLCIALTAFAATRTLDGSGQSEPASTRGSYTVVTSWYPAGPGLSWGMTIKDDVANSMWISYWTDLSVHEYDMTTGLATGANWVIPDSIDAGDMAFCEYGTGNQYFIADFTFSNIGVFSDDGEWIKNLAGPTGWPQVWAVGAGHDMLYCGKSNMIVWGSYTGTEIAVTWTQETLPFIVYGFAVYGDYLFICTFIENDDNIFIYYINADGSVNMTPVWSCYFTENLGSANGGLDWDGTHLWVYPQNNFVYKLDIDWDPSNLENATWGQIKADF